MHLRDWRQSGEDLHAPWLFRFEVTSALTRLVASDAISVEEAGAIWANIEALGKRIIFHDIEDGPRVMEIAQALRRQSAYDAAYVALAESLGTEVWTIDGPLARNAEQTGLPVRLIEIP
ncbi:MAG: type II toxin-antitoxin system VapC family toxin [Solirubrobacteraceae bacterium]